MRRPKIGTALIFIIIGLLNTYNASHAQENLISLCETMVTVSGDQIEAALRQSSDISLCCCVVDGKVDFHDSTNSNIAIMKTNFLDSLQLSGATFTGKMVFSGVDFKKGLDFSGSEFIHEPGLFSAENACLLRHGERRYLPLHFDSCKFRGPVVFDNSNLQTSILFANTIFDDVASFDYARCSYDILFGFVHFRYRARFNKAHFDSEFVLIACQFNQLSIKKTDLSRTDFRSSRFASFIFEPDSPPPPQCFANVIGLEKLTYNEDPSSLVRLRNDFKVNGFRDEERKVTYALKVRENQLNYGRGRAIWGFVNTLLFDWTCQYGMNYGRPLLLALYISVICLFVYFAFIKWSSRGGILVEYSGSEEKVDKLPVREWVARLSYEDSKKFRYVWRKLKHGVKLFLFAMLSSGPHGLDSGLGDGSALSC